MFGKSANSVSVTPYGNIGMFFSKAFENTPTKVQNTEQEKTTTPFWEFSEHVFPSFSDNLAKSFSNKEKDDEQQTEQKKDNTALIVVQPKTNK